MTDPQHSETPLVSVVIPVYNGANYLGEAIDSVLAQTFQDYELIVIDDGSEDDTPAVAEAYGDKLTYIHQENRGVAGALNHGITSAQGKYVAWLSHDDVFLPHKLERQVAFMQQHPQLRACYSHFYTIDADGKIIEAKETPWYPRHQALLVLFARPYINGCSTLIERSCFDEVGLFDERLRYTQDTEMWIRMVQHFEIGRLPEFLLKYRVHAAQGTISRQLAQTAEAVAMYTRKSVALWPSWRNAARLKLAIGARRYSAIARLPGRVASCVRGALRAKPGACAASS